MIGHLWPRGQRVSALRPKIAKSAVISAHSYAAGINGIPINYKTAKATVTATFTCFKLSTRYIYSVESLMHSIAYLKQTECYCDSVL